jgi:alpha-tubulin suppressor-like RCC1 family protein
MAVNGVAEFPGLAIDKTGVGYTLVASAVGPLPGATSTPFDITPGLPSQIAWLEQPAASGHAGVALPPFRVVLKDAAGNVVTDQPRQVRLTVSSSSGGGRLVAFPINAQFPNTVEGIATFSGFKFDRAGTYTLRATSQTYFVESNPISMQLAFARVTAGGGPVFSAPITQSRYACSISTMGALHCWGGSIWGAMGIETFNAQANVLQPELVVTGQLFKDIDAGNIHTCAVTIAGAAYCWGANLNGRLGAGDPQLGTQAHPRALPGGLHFVSISAGDSHTCGVTSPGPGVLSGPAYCWGNNGSGQLGDGTFDERSAPTLVSGGHSFIAVSASHGGHTCGTTTAFATYCWGNNIDGQLGDASTTTRNVPTLVQNSATHLFRSVSTGRFHTCAVQADNATYCWGANTSQQLGDGNTAQTDRTAPSLVTASVTGVSGGWLHTCGLGAGTALCWGANDGGQLGDGGTTERNAPGAISGSLNISQVAAGQDFSCGVTADNRLYCWGTNDFGQLGDGTTTQRLSPVRVFP